jgi:outer membrane protein OmpA-like peptidoglycan-associated protein
MYYTTSNKLKLGLNDKGENRLQIYLGSYVNDKVTDVVPFEHNNNLYDFTTPCIVNEKLYFSSNMPGGFGGYDLYQCEKLSSGKWSIPVNVGEKVNSSGDEKYPYVIGDDLYYSSTGMSGHGGADIFFTNAYKGVFNTPINLGKGVNSSADDFSFKVIDEIAYLVSNRESSTGRDMIYSVTGFSTKKNHNTDGIHAINKSSIGVDQVIVKEENGREVKYLASEDGTVSYETPLFGDYLVLYSKDGYEDVEKTGDNFKADNSVKTVEMSPNYKGQVIDMITGEEMENVSVKAIDTRDSTTISETKTKPDGKWWVAAPNEDYVSIEFGKDSYKTSYVEASGNVGKDINMAMVPEAKKGNKIEIRNIYFDLAKSTIKTESFEILDNIFKYLTDNPDVRVELSAHTDSRGGDSYNLKLSSARAKAAFAYLVEKGIDKSRMVPKGYGEKQLVNDCSNGADCSEEQHASNRRVELKIL